jgi:Leucine-rich repeat (LRR) protein
MKIEGLNKLKRLRYINLALNNITRIEGLSGCESLEKLDLTVNFVPDVRQVIELNSNIFLKDLHLIGNPCTSLDGYRDYVVGCLPSLKVSNNIFHYYRCLIRAKLRSLNESWLDRYSLISKRITRNESMSRKHTPRDRKILIICHKGISFFLFS